METVAHLWNVNQFMTKLKCPLTAELQTFYMQTCKNLSSEVELPKQNFGPSVMCSHCGSLWDTVDYQVRISRGRKMSKSVRKIVKSMNENNGKIPKVRATLAEKSRKNEMNKLVIKCSICSKKTVMPFVKKNRLKPIKLDDSQLVTPQSKRKKKKRKSRDKTAGLTIPGRMSNSRLNEECGTSAKSRVIVTKINNKKLATPIKKHKKLNIERLKHIVTSIKTPTKRKSLHNFLTQLDFL